MKLSSYYKKQGDEVELLLDYDTIDEFDHVFISKVFTDTPIDETILNKANVQYGGTGFFYDKAPSLPNEIEHIMPDYTLYDGWVKEQISNGRKRSEFEYYLDYSIGFTTRGCFRGCEFCVNKNSKKSVIHSALEEFLDIKKKYICLWDDNVFACSDWKNIFESLQRIGKPFTYRQGLDERILTDEKSIMLQKSKWRGDIIFAFDNINDKDLILEKLQLYKKHNKRQAKFYVFCGFDRDDQWGDMFWKRDIEDTFERIKILMQYGSLPYIMRFNRYIESPYYGTYIN